MYRRRLLGSVGVKAWTDGGCKDKQGRYVYIFVYSYPLTPPTLYVSRRYKRRLIEGHPLRNSAALRVEPDQYHLTPHVDMFQKVVTWQFFHPESGA